MEKNNVAATVKTNNTEVNKEKRMNKTERRLAKFARRREAGKAYTYKPNPFPKGSDEWYDEQWDRAHKNGSSKTPFARMTSIMAKLDNQLKAEEMARKAKKSEKKSKKQD